ncbi:MAG: glycosyltransferase family 39 protein [Melioribacteraceae bacterium]|nr:glycosyltransferase family 39 protein [Melioribacteraceae bacterium]
MQSDQSESRKWPNLLLFTISLIPIILFVFVFMQRAAYPFDLEWAEGAAVNQVNHILSGKALYNAPSLSFAPLVYTPLYHYLAAGLSHLVGVGFLPLRIISIICSLGSGLLIFLIVRKETGNPLLAWISGAFFLACFELSDGFFDLARVDSEFIFVILLGLFICIQTKNRWGDLLVVFVFIAAFFVKQSAVIVFLPLVIGLVWVNYRRYWFLLVVFAIGIVLPWIFIDRMTGGLFSFYTLALPRLHGYSILSAANFWIGDIAKPLGIAIGFSVLWILGILRTWRENSSSLENNNRDQSNLVILIDPQAKDLSSIGKILLFIVGAITAAWITRASNGGGANNVMAAYAAISLSLGLGVEFSKRIVIGHREGNLLSFNLGELKRSPHPLHFRTKNLPG